MQAICQKLVIVMMIGLLPVTGIGAIGAQPFVTAATRSLPHPGEALPQATHKKATIALVFFFLSTCPRCHRMAPIIQHYAVQHHEHVYAFSLDGGALPDFPHPLPATSAIRRAFLGSGVIETPVVFVIDVNTLNAAKILEGRGVDATTLAIAIQQGEALLQTAQ